MKTSQYMTTKTVKTTSYFLSKEEIFEAIQEYLQNKIGDSFVVDKNKIILIGNDVDEYLAAEFEYHEE